MSQNISKKSRVHLALSLIISCVIGYYLGQVVLNENYPDKELYHGAELRFTSVAGVRSSDFVIKRKNQQFLIAPNIPKELKASIELSSAGRYFAHIEPEYPDWLCESDDLDKAQVLIQGGSLNESVKLVRSSPQELSFTAAKGQRLTLTVKNRKNLECGRALMTLYRVSDSTIIKAGLLLIWLCVFGLCIFSVSSPYIVTLGILANTLLLAAEASLAEITTGSILVNTGFALAFAGMLFCIASIPFRSRLIALLGMLGTTILLSPALSFITYELVFSTPFSMEAVHGALQSYGSQALEFWSEFVGKRRTLYLLLALFLLYLCFRNLNQARAIVSKALVFGMLLILVGSAASIGTLHNSGIVNLLLESMIVYRWEIDAFQKVANQRKNYTAEAARTVKHSNDSTVVVFGESVNKKQMSAYGYVRQTTPLLDRRIADGEVVLFTSAYSNHTHSNPTMSLILTQANQYGGKPWQESASVFNYARAAKVETHWLTNHRLLGGWSNNITAIISEADRLKTINFMIGLGSESTHYDQDLVPLFKQAIEERPNQFTFLHLYNSHSYYCHRYPQDLKYFEGSLSHVDYGGQLRLRRTSDSMINCYDNTIYYTDQILEKLINELESRDNPSVLLYAADHADELLDSRAHNSAVFTFDMINIPLIVWANEAWREKHADVWAALNSNSDKVITNDLMFESVLGLAGIRASSIDTKMDISSLNYEEPSKPLTLYGRMPIDHPNNWNYWQQQNLKHAKKIGLELIAVDLESIGEAKLALAIGINKLQINVAISPQGGLVWIAKDGNQVISPIADLVESLEQSDASSMTFSLVESSSADIAEGNELIVDLRKQTELAVMLALADEIVPISLARPDFADKVTELSVSIDGSYNFTPVTLSSRYTNPPPEPNMPVN